jgi:hypothetical protein
MILCVAAALAPGAGAIETDQFYAWDRELDDSTDMLNAKVNAEIQITLERLNAKPAWAGRKCHEVAKRIDRHFRLLIFHDLELWANNTSLIARIPATPEEELRYRREYLYSNHALVDPGTWMPPSPTIEAAGVRFGTDKLTHFFSEGWFSYGWYRKAIQKGLTPEEAQRRAIKHGITLERSVLGTGASGVFSPADLEANYSGMEFFIALCTDESPGLQHGEHGWELSEPFDFRRQVSPEWDESYQPSVYTKRRWKKVRPVMLDYCPLLDSAWVQRQRKEYAGRDRHTMTELWIEDLVEMGKLTDPADYSIDRVCEGFNSDK